MKTLVLVDIENFCASAIPSPQSVRLAKVMIDRIAKINPDEAFYVIGCHDGLRQTIAKNWPRTDSKGQINRDGFSHSGKDGADRSIHYWLSLNEHRKAEWKRIVLVSGDHYFLGPLLAYALPKSEIVQIARNAKSRHHDYLRFKKRFKTIFLDEVIKTPIAQWTLPKVKAAIDAWFEAKHQAHLSRTKKTKDKPENKLVEDKSNPPSKSKKKKTQQFTKGQLELEGKLFTPGVWEQSHDWVFEDKAIYLSSVTYKTFRVAQIDAVVTLRLRNGDQISAIKK